MERKTINYELFDTRWWLNFDYKDYVAECEDLGKKAYPEDSNEYWNWIYDTTNMYWDDFKDNLKYCTKYNNCPCMITGKLGLWNGNPDIVPVYKNTIWDAIMKCISGGSIQDYLIEMYDGHIVVYAYHHDGCNTFDIHLLSKRGIEEVNREKFLIPNLIGLRKFMVIFSNI